MLLKLGPNYIRGVILEWRRPYHSVIRCGCNEKQKNDLISNLIIEFIQIMVDEWTLRVREAEWGEI